MTDEHEHPKELPKVIRRPITESLPAYLKDPKNYDKINKYIIQTLASKHSHGEVVEWAKCAACQRRFAERSNVLKKLGFPTIKYYMAWKRIHERMKTLVRDRISKYDE